MALEREPPTTSPRATEGSAGASAAAILDVEAFLLATKAPAVEREMYLVLLIAALVEPVPKPKAAKW